jgi:hypothetical protein
VPRANLVPVFRLDANDEYLRKLDFKRLQEDLLKEQERLEKAVREGKFKKYLKWKKIKEEAK